MYADDLALLAPTRKSMQTLLDICQNYGLDWCLTYNPAKTNILVFGKIITHEPLYLNGTPIVTVASYRYFGMNLLAIRKPLMSFYCSANMIFNVLKTPSEEVLMNSSYSNCVPILTYAC